MYIIRGVCIHTYASHAYHPSVQEAGEHAGALGTFQLVRPTPLGGAGGEVADGVTQPCQMLPNTHVHFHHQLQKCAHNSMHEATHAPCSPGYNRAA